MSAESFRSCIVQDIALQIKRWEDDPDVPHPTERGVFPMHQLNVYVFENIIKMYEETFNDTMTGIPFANALVRCPILYAAMNENEWIEREVYVIDLIYFYLRTFVVLKSSDYAIDFSADGKRIAGNINRKAAGGKLNAVILSIVNEISVAFENNANITVDEFSELRLKVSWKMISSLEVLICQLCPFRETKISKNWITSRDAFVLPLSNTRMPLESSPLRTMKGAVIAFSKARSAISDVEWGYFRDGESTPLEMLLDIENELMLKIMIETPFWEKTRKWFDETFRESGDAQ
jgi:hypothetical protein